MILTFPYYDPDGRHNQAFQRQLETLKSTFHEICMTAIPPTLQSNAEFVQYLEEQGCVVFHSAPNASFGEPSREALRLALVHATARQPIFFGYLDRILFALETEWRNSFLQDLETYQTADYVIFERSQMAWNAHPSNYREIEQMVSRMFELLWGQFIELSPGAFIMSYPTANTILSQSVSTSFAVWGEWILLAMKNGISVTARKVDWLMWEDPYWQHIEPDQLKRSRETSREETVKRIKWNVPLMLMLTEARFRDLKALTDGAP